MTAPRPLTPEEKAQAAALQARYGGGYPGPASAPINEEAALRERHAEQMSPAWFEAGLVVGDVLKGAARGPSLADAAMSAIRGGQDAQRLIFSIREGCAPADTLMDGMVQVLKLGDPDRTRAFFRELQKRLERGA